MYDVMDRGLESWTK